MCVVAVDFVFVPAITRVLPITVSVGSVIALHVVGCKCHSDHEDGVSDSILTHFGGMQRCRYYFKRAKSCWR